MSMTKKHSQQLVYVALSRMIFNIKNFIFIYLRNFKSKVFISNFSYHKPTVSLFVYDTNDDESEQNFPE